MVAAVAMILVEEAVTTLPSSWSDEDDEDEGDPDSKDVDEDMPPVTPVRVRRRGRWYILEIVLSLVTNDAAVVVDDSALECNPLCKLSSSFLSIPSRRYLASK